MACTNGRIINGQCYPCPTNVLPDVDKKQCLCGDKYENTVYDEQQNQCICTQISTYFTGAWCACVANTYYNGVNCVQCNQKAFRYLTQLNDSCTCADTNAIFDKISNICTCNGNFVNQTGKCVQCPLGSSKTSETRCSCSNYNINNNSCICNNGQYGNGVTCQNCQSYQTVNEQRTGCICKNSGFNENDTCKHNFYRFQNTCLRCPVGSFKLGNNNAASCTTLGGLSLHDVNANKVTCVDSSSKNVQINNGNCVYCGRSTNFGANWCGCNGNYVFSNNSLMCVANSQYFLIQSSLVHCGSSANRNPDGDQYTCTCYIANALFVRDVQHCICPDDYVMINGSCFKCPLDSKRRAYQFFGCECLNQNEVYDLSDNRCKCQQNYYNNSGICVRCPTNSYRNDINDSLCTCIAPHTTLDKISNKCICPTDYYQKEGLCRKCPSRYNGISCDCQLNEVFNDVQQVCICQQNHVRVNGICVPCGAGATRNLADDETKCVCAGANEEYNQTNNSCQCQPHYALNIASNVCIKCPSNSLRLFNQDHCQCIAPQTSFDILSNKCTCASSNSIIINNICVQCPLNSISDGTTCNCQGNKVFDQTTLNCHCQENYYLVNGSCLQCPAGSTRLGVQEFCTCTDIDAFLNSSSGLCDCVANYFLKNVACTKCVDGAIRMSGHSSCECGSTSLQFNPVTNQCRCAGNYYNSSGLCRSCPSDAMSDNDNQTCRCTNANKVFDQLDATCRCQPNNYQINSVCTLCSNGMQDTIDQRGCQCLQEHAVFDSINNVCNCQNNYVLDILSNICVPCPIYAIRTQLQLQCVCQAPFVMDVANNKCICENQKIPYQNGCFTCPINSVFNGGQCICNDEHKIFDNDQFVCKCLEQYYFDDQLNCLKCPINVIQTNDQLSCDCSFNGLSNAYYNKLTKQCVCNDTNMDISRDPLCKTPHNQMFTFSAGGFSAVILVSFLIGFGATFGFAILIQNKIQKKN